MRLGYWFIFLLKFTFLHQFNEFFLDNIKTIGGPQVEYGWYNIILNIERQYFEYKKFWC
jgi:hypothetical protein